MFYSQLILAKKGPLGKIWLAAHFKKKLNKKQIYSTSIKDSVGTLFQFFFIFLFKCPHFKNITFRRFNQLTILLLCSSFSNSASLCHITRRTFIASCLRPSTSWYCTYLCIEMSLFSARQRINKKENINGFSKKNR